MKNKDQIDLFLKTISEVVCKFDMVVNKLKTNKLFKNLEFHMGSWDDVKVVFYLGLNYLGLNHNYTVDFILSKSKYHIDGIECESVDQVISVFYNKHRYSLVEKEIYEIVQKELPPNLCFVNSINSFENNVNIVINFSDKIFHITYSIKTGVYIGKYNDNYIQVKTMKEICQWINNSLLLIRSKL